MKSDRAFLVCGDLPPMWSFKDPSCFPLMAPTSSRTRSLIHHPEDGKREWKLVGRLHELGQKRAHHFCPRAIGRTQSHDRPDSKGCWKVQPSCISRKKREWIWGVSSSSGAELPWGLKWVCFPGGVPGHTLLCQKRPEKGLLCSCCIFIISSVYILFHGYLGTSGLCSLLDLALTVRFPGLRLQTPETLTESRGKAS